MTSREEEIRRVVREIETEIAKFRETPDEALPISEYDIIEAVLRREIPYVGNFA